MQHVCDENACKCLVGKPGKEKDCLTDLGTDGDIILQYVLKKYGERMLTRFIWTNG
jgi:hypothetical protein